MDAGSQPTLQENTYEQPRLKSNKKTWHELPLRVTLSLPRVIWSDLTALKIKSANCNAELRLEPEN